MIDFVYMKKAEAKDCPVTKTALLFSDTWTTLILRDLLKGQQRFCELERSLSGISTRTLTLKLKKLEKDAIVKKTEDGYILTKKGKAVKPVLLAMERLGRNL